MVRPLDGISPGALDDMMKAANDGWGFTDSTGKVDGSNGFWKDPATGKVKVGGLDIEAFLKMSNKSKLDYINSDVFSSSARNRVNTKLDANFSPDFKKSVEAGLPGRRAAQADIMDGGQVKPGKVGTFDALMSKFSAKMAFGAAAGVWTLVQLQQLAESLSGCFLVGPDGQEEKMSAGDCSCAGDTNPNALACCSACNTGGDNFLCPGLVSSDDPPPPGYQCPSEVETPPGRARQMRATISAQAAKSRDRAKAIASTRPAPQALFDLDLGGGGSCVSCGCDKGGEWTLCHREFGVFDVIGNLLAAGGEMLQETAEGVWDIVSDGVMEIASAMKIVIIVISVVVALAVAAAVTVGVIKIVKKKKRGRLLSS